MLDVNGTLTHRGEPIAGVADALVALSAQLDLHALSADTFGTAQAFAERVGATFAAPARPRTSATTSTRWAQAAAWRWATGATTS